jgi:hypothetical protein
VGCGEDIDDEDCFLPIFSQGNDAGLKDHPSFSHIPENVWQNIVITNKEWCPDQVCPDSVNPVHCLEETSSSSSFAPSSSSSSSFAPSSSSSSSAKQSSSSSSSAKQSSSSSSSSESICTECPSFNTTVSSYPTITNDWDTVSGAIDIGGCFTIKFASLPIESGRQWNFKCGCEDGASATFRTSMTILETGACSSVVHTASTCNDGTNIQSSIHNVAGTGNDFYVKVFQIFGLPTSGTFTLAYGLSSIS